MVPISDVPIATESPPTLTQVPTPPPEWLGQRQAEEAAEVEEVDIEALDPAAEALLWFG